MVQIRAEHAPNDLPTRQVVADWALDNGKIAFAKEQAEAACESRPATSALRLYFTRIGKSSQLSPAFPPSSRSRPPSSTPLGPTL